MSWLGRMAVEPGAAPETPGKDTVRRKRFQHGCVRKVKHGRRWVWIGKYRENGEGRTKVLGLCAELTEGGAWSQLQELLRPLNEQVGQRRLLPSNFRSYVLNVYLPQRRKLWKDSTDQTTTERIHKHLLSAFGDCELADLTRDRLQQFLDQKARSHSRSVVSHLRWDLNGVCRMACDDSILSGNPAGSLVTPKTARAPVQRRMTKAEVQRALTVLDLRERIIFLLAVLVGMRPGEILALRWERMDDSMIDIAERVYRGLPDDPKSERGKRQAALPPNLSSDITAWREVSDTSAEQLVFPSERGTYLSRDNFLRRNIQKKLGLVGLGWVNFQVLRRTQASLGHDEKVDPKVAADQRGHALGVAINTYTESDQASRMAAVKKLENAITGGLSR